MSILKKYASLLLNYCLDLKENDKLFIRTTYLAEPLVRELYRQAMQIGAHIKVDASFREQQRIFYQYARSEHLSYIFPGAQEVMESYDCYLYIRAPYNLKEDHDVDRNKVNRRQQHLKHLNNIYSERTADGSMRRTLCQFPTLANAQEAGMSLEEYEEFVYSACRLDEEIPAQAWREVRKSQQRIVDYLNQVDQMTYRNERFEVSFSVKDRIWINSDGRTNMPSGEVFTGPVEDSVSGEIYFDYPTIFMGKEMSGIHLVVKNGEVKEWKAEVGQDVLDKVFEIDGSRYFGEVAIGTNYNIQQATKNILFDEKIGGTIHMAVGQSYKQTGGKNESPLHLDMIADMTHNGSIIADNEVIFQNGQFLI